MSHEQKDCLLPGGLGKERGGRDGERVDGLTGLMHKGLGGTLQVPRGV